MEETTSVFSLGLFLGQLFLIVLLVLIAYYVIKIYKKIIKYLNSKN